MSSDYSGVYPQGSFDQHNGVLHLMVEYSGPQPEAVVFEAFVAQVTEIAERLRKDDPQAHILVQSGNDAQDFDLTDAEQMIAQSKALVSTIRQNLWHLQDVQVRQYTLTRKIAWIRKKLRAKGATKFNDADLKTYRTMVELRGKAGADEFYRARGMEIPPMEILVNVHEVTDDGIK